MNEYNFKNLFTKLKIRLYLKVFSYIFISFILLSLLFNTTIQLSLNSQKPIGAYLVLGGSITREIYAAKLNKNNPDNLPIIISRGSNDPCIFFVFKREKSPVDNVWLENCADSTFGNFFFSVSLLKKWGIKKVKVITSDTHLPRAKLIAQIFLYSRGIALDLETAKETKGIPANQENRIKTILDVIRSLLWAFFGQFINPSCDKILNLSEIDLDYWLSHDFKCERQGNINIDHKQLILNNK